MIGYSLGHRCHSQFDDLIVSNFGLEVNRLFAENLSNATARISIDTDTIIEYTRLIDETKSSMESKPKEIEMEKILFVDSPIKKALFDLCIRPEFEPGGKWGTESQKNLVNEWKDVEVRVAEDGQPLGRTFPAQKTNWNVNDSNWVNPTKNYTRLASAARDANGGTEVPKKTLTGHLEDLKKIFSLEVQKVEDEAA